MGISVSSGQVYDVASGQSLNGATVTHSGYLEVESGGKTSGTTISSGGYLIVDPFGTALNTTINAGGIMQVEPVASATGVVVKSGGVLNASGYVGSVALSAGAALDLSNDLGGGSGTGAFSPVDSIPTIVLSNSQLVVSSLTGLDGSVGITGNVGALGLVALANGLNAAIVLAPVPTTGGAPVISANNALLVSTGKADSGATILGSAAEVVESGGMAASPLLMSAANRSCPRADPRLKPCS